MGDLGPFPTDEPVLAALEHALASSLTYDRPADADPDDDGPWRIGGDYGVNQLLDLLAGVADDGTPATTYRVGPGLERLTPDEAARDDALGVDQTWVDERPHYTRDDVIIALIAEVRRLRGDTGRAVTKPAGYDFPGVVVGEATTVAGLRRFVVESTVLPGMLHIFAPHQLADAATGEVLGDG